MLRGSSASENAKRLAAGLSLDRTSFQEIV